MCRAALLFGKGFTHEFFLFLFYKVSCKVKAQRIMLYVKSKYIMESEVACAHHALASSQM